MIKEFVQIWDEHKTELEQAFQAKHPDNYADIVHKVITMLSDHSDEYEGPDPKRIHEIDDGDYQGILLFVIGAKGYQPSQYWFVKVYYGSCSGCDTLQDIKSQNYEDTPTETQVKDYMSLALHIMQGIKPLEGGSV